jgi:hypothetical protein
MVEKVIPIPAPPVGSVWAVDTTAGIEVGFTMASAAAGLAGTSGWSTSSTVYGVTGQVNFMGILNADLAFSVAALYLDPDNTGVAPKWEMPDEAEELRACKRYWQKNTDPDTGFHYGVGDTSSSWHGQSYLLPVPMRATPALTLVDPRSYTNCTFGDQSATASSYILRLDVTATGSYRGYAGSVAFNARL